MCLFTCNARWEVSIASGPADSDGKVNREAVDKLLFSIRRMTLLGRG